MGGMTVDDGDNIIIKNNEIIGLTVRPDGAVRTPKGGAGGFPIYKYNAFGIILSSFIAPNYCLKAKIFVS